MDVEVRKVIDRIKFSFFSPEMIRKMSVAKITVPDTYDDEGYPIDGGLVDLRLGVVDPGLKCKTCGGNVKSCPGHFGIIELVRPVVHVEFVKHIYFVLKNTCHACHKVLKKVDKTEVEKELEESTTSSSSKTAKKCANCGADVPEIKIIKPTGFMKDKEVMLPNEVREWLASISDEDLRALGFDPVYARPEWMILTVLPVPPVSVRPSITLESGERSEDDLTHKLVDVIRINQKLEANINAGAPQLIIEDLWELLQYHVTTYFDNETAHIPPARHRSGRPLKTLAQRLKGKEGRFRYNLSGKRVNFSARTVISPDPRIRLDEVGVPQPIAEELTIPLKVTPWNLDYCKQLVMRAEYPRALYIIRSDGRRLRVGSTEEMRREQAENLKVGYTIERQVMDGDIALFNRQPSLHRISMMAHSIKVLPGRTFRLNPTVTPPYNADFDGDEMNLHVMQTEEAQAEARFLAKVEDQILSPRHGHAIIKPQEDQVSGLYALTRDGAEFTKTEASEILYAAGIKKLPKPDLKNGNYSGKLLFSQLLPRDVNLKLKTKIGEDVVIKNGKLIKGALDGKAMGGELLEYLFINHGSEFTRDFLDAAMRMGLHALFLSGFSVSLKDYSLSEKGLKRISEILDKMNREIDNLILQYKNKTLERFPGVSLQETLESTILEITTKARNQIGDIVEEELGKDNTSIIMAKIGARGSLLNAIQMSAVVAQQTVRSKRPARGYKKRLLPYFKKAVLAGEERGFVYASFHKGLNPAEFFAHAMGGRESLVNKAIRTARSGYMQRRLINALQDLTVAKDLSVRNADDSVVQFIYGGDGRDPMFSATTEAVATAKQDDVDTA